MMKRTALCLALCLAVVYSYDLYGYQMAEVDNLGESFLFLCEGYDIPSNSTAEFWILPNLENTNDTDSSTKQNVVPSPDQMQINVTNIAQSDLGTYLCVVTTPEGDVFMQRYGLNLKGPYFEDLVEKYDTCIIIAFSAMISFLLSAIYIWVVYKFSYGKRMASRIEPDDFEMGVIDKKAPDDYKGSVNFANGNGVVNEAHEDSDNEQQEENAKL